MSWIDDFNKLMGVSTTQQKQKQLASNSWLQEYNRIALEEEERKKREAAQRKKEESSIETKTTVTPSKKDKEDESLLDFFQVGGLDDIDLGSRFEDGWQFGDGLKTAYDTLLGVGKTILGTAGDAGLEVVKGAGGMLEGIVDAASYGMAGVSDLIGQKEYAEKVRSGAKMNLVEDLTRGADNYLEQYSVLGRTSDAFAQGIGQVGSLILTGGLGQAAGLGSAGVTALTTGSMGLSGMGSGMSQAYKEGATDEEALTYGAIAGTADALSELIFGGLGKTMKATGLSTGLSSADDMLAKKVSNLFTSQIAKNFAEFGIKAGAEGFEEILAGTAQAIGKKITYMSEEDLWEIVKDENLLEQFVVGAATSGVIQSGLVPGMSEGSLKEANREGKDFITGFTQNEQAVIAKEVEKRVAQQEKSGKKLTKNEKAAIEVQVEKDLDKGYISTDTIEEVLGGETYQRYKQTIDSENALKEKQKALQEEFDTLNKMKQGEMTGEQIDRRADLKEELAKINESVMSAENHSPKTLLQERLSKEVSEMVRSDRLIESYNEVERRKQAFEADLTKYDTKQRAVIEKAVKSGILNNTNRTHEFVDMVAKISADKGVLFDFTNNKRLKESGFAIDGKTVNGYVTKDGITINIQSKKSLNSLVGHEITHVLEGTELYTELQNTLIEYAKTKGDYQGRYDALTKLYEGVEGADINAELTADLVGDYLFTDENFINSLSVNHRNVFQKIYDEVKYLLKVATAGSKEARDLEKVKRAFEKAYQESTKVESDNDADTKYSLVSDQETIDFLENQEHMTVYKAMAMHDGKLYAPMASQEYVDEEVTLKNGKKKIKRVRKLKNPSVLGQWQQSDERPDLIKSFQPPSEKHPEGYGKFDLLKSNGKTTGGVAYNPYEHTSNIVMNDQFSGAYQRPELVTVEYRIPMSEMTSGYKAKYAKDSVGLTDWKAGGVAQKLKNSHRDVYLTRWSKPVRVLPDSEVAQKYKEILDKEDGISIPWNVVTPSLRMELEKAGVPIDYSVVYKGKTFEMAEEERLGAKYSLSDSEGRQLSNEQSEYFKNSSIRDNDGNLMVLYHGTQNDFTVFDIGRSGENYEGGWSEYGEGIYLTPDKKSAEYYGDNAGWGREVNLMEVYANIKNPFNVNDPVDFDISDLVQKYELTEFDERHIKKAGYRLVDLLKHHNLSVRDYLTGKGYDGVWEKDLSGRVHQVVAYTENQIKNTNNQKPTADPDIRYSLSADSWSQIQEKQMELNRLDRSIREFKASDSYKNQMEKITEAIGSGNADEAIRDYNLWYTESGLEELTNKRNSLRDELDKLRKEYEEARANEALEEERIAIEKSGLSEADYFRKQAVKEFGYTPNFYDAGYITPNGKMLNFSGEKGRHFGVRGADHRNIGIIYENTQGSDAMVRFMNDGNIRIMAETPGIDISSKVELTKEQYATIRKFARESASKEYFAVDISDENGRSIGTYEYEGRIFADRIINDIKYFFQNGKVRESSGLSNFLSLSDPDAENPVYGNYNVYGSDVALETEIAPVGVSKMENSTPAQETQLNEENSTVSETEMVEDLFPDGIAPEVELENLYQQAEALGYRMREAFNEDDTDALEQASAEYADAMERIETLEREIKQIESSRMDSIAQSEEPPEMDAPFYGEPEASVMPDDPFEDRDYGEVGKRNVNAYMYENPEVKPFFQMEANAMLGDLGNSIRGERLFNDQVYYDSGGEKGWMGTKRMTTDDIAYLLDSGYTYADIEKGLNAIIEDNGKENNAVSKRIEFALNDRLLKGYTNIYGDQIQPDQDYINLLREKEITAYSQEAFDAFMANADQYAPEEIGPVAEDFSEVQNITSAGQQTFLPAGKPRPNIGSDDIAPTYDVTGKKGVPDGQQAFMPDAGVEPKLTRKQLHQNIVDQVKASFQAKGFDFDNVLKKAKDLSTFATVDNTPQRVMEKALGYKQGQVLSELTVDQVAKNETEGIKWLNSFTDRKKGLLAQISKQYNIKPGSKKSAAAQMYAEGFYVGENDEIIAYGDRELAMDFPNVKVQQQIKGLARDPRIRQIYDETLAAINESRTRNAYPEIPRLDNYFLHFRAMEDTFSRLGLPFNPNDIRAKDLPTDLNGVTADLKPGQPYFASAMHRTGKRTSFDLLGGLEKYLGSAKNQIYHIDDIQTLRAVRNYIAEMYGQATGLENLSELSDEEAQQRIEDVYGSHLSTFAKFLNEEANVLAGKTALIDRGLEGIIGRRGITFLNTLNRQVGSNMVGYNISSSLTNFLAPVQAFAKSNKFDFVKGMAQTAANKVGSIFGHGDGFAEASPVMIRRKGADAFYRTPWQKLSDPGYVLMGAVDEISTELIARAKYNELTRKGMDSQQAHYETDKWVSRLMGDRSLGQQPQLYNSKMLGLVTKFQLEVRNQLDSQFYDTIQEAKVSTEEIQNGLLRNAKKAAKITSTFVQLAVLQHLFGKAFESVAGYNPAFDIISAIIKAFGWDDDEEDEDTVLDNIEEGFFELMGDMPYVSTLTGGRIPIESALPIEELYKGEDKYGNEKSRWKTLGEAAPYYLLPGGYGQIKKTMQGLDMFEEDLPIAGSYTDSGNLRFPVEDTTQNRVQAALFGQWASENARDYFDNEWKPLNEKQTQEFIDSDMPIRDYRDYREGLSDLSTLAEKADYIDGLDLPISTKNLLINNIADRKDPIDMASYDEFDSFEEFDYAQKNPEKYDFLTEYGISYSQYKSFGEDAKEEIDNAYSWVKNNPEKVTFSKAVTDNVLEYRQYTSALNAIRADKDSSGKSISGSAKAKKVDYINSLDLDYGAKLVLFKNEYNADDTYNGAIIEYIISREDFSYEDKVAILKELGFEVSSDGTVTW